MNSYPLKHLRQDFLQNGSVWLNIEKLTDAPQKIFIMLSAEYGNLGDVAISYAMVQLALAKSNVEVYEIPVNDTIEGVNYVKQHICENDEIWLVGGGNLGSRYDIIENCRRLIINVFRQYHIISFPQSIDFTLPESNEIDVKQKELTQIIYNFHENLTLYARDETSFKLMNLMFPNKKLKHNIDAVLQLSKENKLFLHDQHIDRKGIFSCLRNDTEKIESSLFNKALSSIHFTGNFDTHLGNGIRMKWLERITQLSNLMYRFKSAEVVITDRLHGMIFAYMTNTPCIVFENSNHKIREAFEALHSKNATHKIILHNHNISAFDLQMSIKLLLHTNTNAYNN